METTVFSVAKAIVCPFFFLDICSSFTQKLLSTWVFYICVNILCSWLLLRKAFAYFNGTENAKIYMLVKKCASSAVGLGNISEKFGMEVMNNFKLCLTQIFIPWNLDELLAVKHWEDSSLIKLWLCMCPLFLNLLFLLVCLVFCGRWMGSVLFTCGGHLVTQTMVYWIVA
jgi:hypothetical protein